jgi:hypothetical protein
MRQKEARAATRYTPNWEGSDVPSRAFTLSEKMGLAGGEGMWQLGECPIGNKDPPNQEKMRCGRIIGGMSGFAGPIVQTGT